MSEACLLSLLCNTFHRNEQADQDVEGQGQAAQVHHHLLLHAVGHVNLSYTVVYTSITVCKQVQYIFCPDRLIADRCLFVIARCVSRGVHLMARYIYVYIILIDQL